MLVTSPLLSQCLREALLRSPELLGRCVDDAVTSLKALAGQGREVVVHDAASRVWWSLLQNKSTWIQAYTHLLREAFAAHERGQQGADKALQLHASRHELALEDEKAVNEWLDAARLLQQLQSSVEQDLAALDARLNSLSGPGALHVENTPLRPSVFVGVLRELMAAVEPSPETRTTWLRHISPTLGQELRRLYQHLALMLQRATEESATYRVRLVEAPEPVAPPRRDLLGDHSGLDGTGDPQDKAVKAPRLKMPTMGALAKAQSDVSQAVLLAFLQNGGAPFERALTSVYFEQVQAELDRLDERISPPVLNEVVVHQARDHAVPAVDRSARVVDIDSQLPPADWGALADPRERARVVLRLKLKATRIAQVMGIDVVRRLVNQVARDPLLLAPVREAMVALEPTLLRLAMAQPRFFSEADHPARRLVESVARRSFKYNDEFASEFSDFMQPVRVAFNMLNDAVVEDPKVFADVLIALRELWDSQDQREKALKEQRLRAMRFADERQALADHFTRELVQQANLDEVPGFIVEFLSRVWSLVIASARLTHPDGGADPGGYRAVVEPLLWCGRKEVVMRRPAKLFEQLPEVIQTLHRGLDMLGMARNDTKPFFDAMMRLHEPVLGARRARVRHDDAASSSPTPLEPPSHPMRLDETLPATSEQMQPRESEEPWLDQRELHAAGFEEPPPSDYGDLVDLSAAFEDAETAAGMAPLSEQEATALLDQLRVGDWIDLCSHGEWLRAQLIWASARGTLFMFTSSNGRAHSMSKRSCVKLIRRRWLRPVDTHPVVQMAIQAISGEGANAAPSDKAGKGV
jgi:hypothetical protein